MGVAAKIDRKESTPASHDNLYHRDFARWALREAATLRACQLDTLDIEHLAEEIESLGRGQFGKLRSRLAIILLHLLKWDHQPDRRTRSWTLSIRHARIEVENVVEMSPCLRRRRPEALARAYRSARLGAAHETDLPLSTFPEECPYTLDDILNRSILWWDD